MMSVYSVLLYLNNNLKIPYGGATDSDCQFMSAHIFLKTGRKIEPEVILDAALRSSNDMFEHYKCMFINSLLNTYPIEVKINNQNFIVKYELRT